MRTTTHRLIVADARKLEALPSASIDLVVCSPPYPMIAMWDTGFSEADATIENALKKGAGEQAFIRMHDYLGAVWKEVARVLRPSGYACINIGDATRSVGHDFKMYANHVEIVQRFCKHGFHLLPTIFWEKVANAPNKFLGSGMLPAGAYVTLEHEHILLFRKGSKRSFSTAEEKALRQESAYFWEERNKWFRDIWHCNGAPQSMNGLHPRLRSAAYPFEIPYRLINMFSIKGDTVLDPFAGTGTTLLAALASERNSVHIDIHESLVSAAQQRALKAKPFINAYILKRFQAHKDFVCERSEKATPLVYYNDYLGCKVMTRQEQSIRLHTVQKISTENTTDLTSTYVPLVLESDLFELKK